MTLRVTIEKLAPTGEGLVRTNEGVGLVTGALPGEDVDVEVVKVTRKIWRGRAVAVRSPSAARATGEHARGCPACDWAHVDLSAARAWKRDLFFETMRRVGHLPPEAFGEPQVEPSPAGYRLRSRLHVRAAAGGGVSVGAFAPSTHDVLSLDRCEALSDAMRARLPRIAEALPADAAPAELSTVESLDGSRFLAKLTLEGSTSSAASAAAALAPLGDGIAVVDPAGRVLERSGEERLWLPVGPGGRDVAAAPDSFFQANRFLVAPLARYVRELAAEVPPGTALDAFGGSGLFAASLLDAGHAVTSVEGSREATRAAAAARERWRIPAGGAWRVENESVLGFAARDPVREDVVVADPPRAGLGAALTRALAARARRRFVYVSCDPATLARDLGILLPEGFEIRAARLFDLFALTHRVESVVALDRVRGT